MGKDERGEGLAGLVAKWRVDAAKGKAKAAKLKLPMQDTKELTEYDTAMEHCATELETALEAAAPPSTARKLTAEELRQAYDWALLSDAKKYPSLFGAMALYLNGGCAGDPLSASAARTSAQMFQL